jgi:hypothetical protein
MVSAKKRKHPSFQQRPAIEPNRNYDRNEAALACGCAVITLIRAYDAQHLKAYRIGRRVMHSGAHLLAWLEAGGKTTR